MKNNNSIRIIILALIASLSFSCTDIVTYNDGYDDLSQNLGKPVISKITSITNRESAITTGNFRQMIVIQGDNLANVDSLLFNDISVDIKTIYSNRNMITAAIPAKAPVKTTNTITVKTKLGNASSPFTVIIPPVQINGFYNEFANVGDTAIISGNFFDAYDITKEKGSLMLNGTKVNIIKALDTEITFVVPQNTPNNSVLAVSSPKMQTPVQLSFRNPGYQILNYENLDFNLVSTTYKAYVTDGSATGDPKPLTGKFTRVKASYNAYAFATFMYGKFTLPLDDIKNNPRNYYVKFELNNAPANSLSVGTILIGRAYSSTLSYKWNPAASGTALNTLGKWKTITMEAVDLFRLDAAGNSNLVTGTNMNSFYFTYQPSKAISVDLSFCNFRFVRK